MAKTPVRKSARKSVTAQETAANAVAVALSQVSRVVIVQFAGNNQGYSYHTRDESIAVGDYCIVISPMNPRWNNPEQQSFHDAELQGYPAIVKVVDVRETTHSINKASKWIVQKLDLTAAKEEAARRERLEILQAKITKARKEAEERVKLEQLRELSPELSALLDEMDALQAS